jgi:hypothetical protein
MAKIIVGAAMLVAGIALMIYCVPMGAAMMALYGAIASTGFSMVLGGIAQKLQGQHSPAIGIAVKQAASPWNAVYGRSRIGGVIAYLNTYAQQNVALDLVVAHVGHYVARVGNAGGDGLPFGGSERNPKLRPPICLAEISNWSSDWPLGLRLIVVTGFIPGTQGNGDSPCWRLLRWPDNLGANSALRKISRIQCDNE